MASGEMRPYDDYKPSGVEWLGDMPAHWEVRKLRHVLRPVSERNQPQLPLLSVVREQGVVIRNNSENHNVIPDDLTNYKVVRETQFVVNKMKAWQGSYGVSKYNGIVSPAYFVFSINGIDTDFFHHAVRSKAYVPYFAQASDGVRIAQWDLSMEQMREIPVLVPPLPEQIAIARFLDRADRLVRRFIRAREKTVVLLEDYKRAVVHRAVAGRFDVRAGRPYPACEPSGVEWLGDVPAHWEVRRLRHVAEVRVSGIDKHTREGETAVRLCNYVDVYKNDCIRSDMAFMSATATASEIERFRLRAGDVLITKDSEAWNDIGVPAFVRDAGDDVVSGYHLALLRPDARLLDGEYLFQALRNRGVAWQFHVEANGVTRYGLSHGAIKSVRLPLPPLPEQTAIARFLDETLAGVDGAIDRARRQIALLREYRTRLIADAATGKIDVRAAAAALPDDDGRDEPAPDDGGEPTARPGRVRCRPPDR